MARKKLVSAVEEDLDVFEETMPYNNVGFSDVLEEAVEQSSLIEWIDCLARELGLGELKPITPKEIVEKRPKGLDSTRIVREARLSRKYFQ